MAKVQSQPEKKVGNIPSKKRKKKKGTNVYCDLCRRSYNKTDIQVHVHSMQHHRELEAVMGKDSSHECQLCNESSMDLNVYAQHISTAKHIGKLTSLKSRNEKPPSLDKVLGTEVMMKILQRNKMLKKSKKKEMKKKRKRMKAGQKHAEKQAVQNNAITSKVARMGDFKQNKMILKHDIQNKGKNNAFFQNKENNVSCREIWQLPYNQDQFIPLAQQLRSGDHFSVYSHSSPSKPQGCKTDTRYRPHSTHVYPPRVPERIAWSAVRQRDTHKKPYNSETDFASDILPLNGAIIFDQSLGPPEPLQQRSCCSPPPAPGNTSTNAVPVRDVDISTMLRQIRRELGVREPCRADREARRQNSEAAGVKMVQPAGAIEGALHITSAATASVRTSPVSSYEPVSDSGVHPSEKVPAQPICTSAKMTQGRSQTCEKSSVFAGDTYGPLHCSAASSEAEVNICRRVRIAHKPRKAQEGKEANKEQSLREVCQDVRRKTQQKAKGTPRSADGQLSHASEQHISAQAEDVPLSEGFHWESLQHSPSFAHWSELPHRTQDATYSKSCAETGPLIEIAPKHRDPQPEDGNRLTAIIKEEQILEGENGDLINHISAPKRKHKVVTHDGVSDEEPRGKKKLKANKDQDQMAQLLTVSLREEELSHSLEVLDSSLIQARNVLQAAYTEVQRLLLFRQQCTAEVNSLRSKRITILQGMQGGFSFPGESNISERNVTSAVEPAAVVTQSQIFPLSSSAAFPTSSCQLPLQTNPASSISRPQPAPLSLPTMPLKQEIEQLPLSCTSQVPVNQSVPLFPPTLLPSLLLTSPHLVSSTTSLSSLEQPGTEFTVPVSVSPKSSACQQEQVRREELKDFVKTVVFIADTDDEGADIRPAAEKVSTVVSERDHNTSAAVTNNSGGSESDNSVIMIEPPNWDVIDIDETAANVPLHQDIPQKSVSVEFSSASTQTSQQNDDKSTLPTELVQDAAVPPASAVEEEEEEEEEPSLGLFENHQGPVHGLQVYEGRLYTCSGDNTARSYSLTNKECQAVFIGHTKKVNCLVVSSFPNMPVRLFTGSSDQTIRCYDIKTQVCLEQIFLSDRVLCLHIAWNILFAGLANGSVANYDLKTLKQLDVFECHGPRGVSSLGTAQEGARRVLLVGSYDSTISVRDARNGLLLRTLEGHTKTVLCLKVVNDLVFSGSSDTSVHAHNIHTGELIRIYKGHGHAVTSIVILGEVMVTSCLDKVVRVYELQSHDLLQVYGGHRDVVMCMTVHKSVIYTGCYDGSVQAVKLDLMKNYRCWWQNCSLIFGMEEHLVQHLIKDHTNPNLQTAKCRWKGCSAFFAKQESVRQELPEHMQNHVENDSEIHT